MDEDANVNTTRICEWCAMSILQQALICPYCRKWRKDIEHERFKFRTWSITSVIGLLCMIKMFLFF